MTIATDLENRQAQRSGGAGRWIYRFGDGTADGNADMRNLLGGKGANLAEMSNIDLPVPPGFTVTTDVCAYYYANEHRYPDDLAEQVDLGLAQIEKSVAAGFGDSRNPLLVSVRSGARASMPGMMDTILNLGLNDETVKGLSAHGGGRRFAFDSYRRFIQMYGNVVLGIDHRLFEDRLEWLKADKGVELDAALTAEDLESLVAAYKQTIRDKTGAPFPMDPKEQLWGAIGAVFGSWMNRRAIEYRKMYNIPAGWGTAVNVQTMVFGNMGDDCATGVAFTRDPSTGENVFFGEFLVNAQGEDVVSGLRTPQPLTKDGRMGASSLLSSGLLSPGLHSPGLRSPDRHSMEETMPEAFAELRRVRDRLEAHYKDMQEIEFTIQRGQLYMLQTREGKRTAKAALKIAVDLCKDGEIDERQAVRLVDPAALDQLLHPTLDPTADCKILARGLPASPGAAVGRIVFSADEAEDLAAKGEEVILVRAETSPEDIHGMHAARGILTTRGGMTSHAAVVARGMGRPCVSGAGDIRIDYDAGEMRVRGHVLKAGDIITIDGSSGDVIEGAAPTIDPELSGDFTELMGWADKIRRMNVRANAETPSDARAARGFGAEGIGLCRTEHMFFDTDRIVAMREMIVAESPEGRRAALDKILPMQREDFCELFRIMAGLPVTIRLLDPPLHEFLPHAESEMQEVAAATGADLQYVKMRTAQLHETNPMLGHRGCRLGVSYPEIYEMQARAIFEAAVAIGRELGETVIPEVMIPLVAVRREFDILKERIDAVAAEVRTQTGSSLEYLVGTMIELPRAALCAGEIGETAEFFSFGTNDLTQTAFGMSRDDAAAFLGDYERQGVLERDPFVTLDTEGVGELVRIASKRGRQARANLKLGICGEHGGDPASIRFCEEVGLDYVSCSPFRVPIARLAAAQATLEGN